MNVFADTSGLFALISRNDHMHMKAKESFNVFAQQDIQLVTSSFVLVETIALLQRRIGLASVHDFNAKILPLLQIIWTDKDWYLRAMQRLLMENQRHLSLVDCLSLEIMESNGITHAFSFDKHFEDFGFSISPPSP